jgi:ribosomal protein S4E
MELGVIRVLEKSTYIHLEDGNIFITKADEIKLENDLVLIIESSKIVGMFKIENVKSVNIGG